MRLFFYLAIAYVVYNLVKKISRPTQGPLKRNRGKADKGGESEVMDKVEETVLDPVCDSYIAKAKAVKKVCNSKTYYFCTEECRDKFVADKGA